MQFPMTVMPAIAPNALVFALMLLAGRAAAVQAQDTRAPDSGMAPLEQYLMEAKSEIALARSAAPVAISGEATVLVLTRRGYESAAKGSNGFVCMVDRQWGAFFSHPDFWNPRVRGPVCLNPQAVRSVLPVLLRRTELALAGVPKLEMMARIESAFERGQLSPPEPGAMAYMMSKEQHLDDKDPHFKPHVMFYLPNAVTGADWGANLTLSPVIVGPARLPNGKPEPQILFLVPVASWSDGTAAHAPGSR